jgi:hypothetical protein
MRYYDISGRVAVFTVVPPQVVSSTTEKVIHNGTAGDYVPYCVDRTGFYSYMLHVSAYNTFADTADAFSLSIQLESCATTTNGATWTSGHTDVTSLTTDGTGVRDAYYKPLYAHVQASVPANITINSVADVGPNFYDQCTDVDDATYGFTVATASGANNACVDARIMGTLRNDEVLRYLSPHLVYKNTDDGGAITIAAELILGAGDQLPVIEGGTAGTAGYYSKGQ